MNGRSLSWVLSQTALVTASIVLAVFIFPSATYAFDFHSLQEVSVGGATIHQGDTVTRDQFTSLSSFWSYTFAWPYNVPNSRAGLVLFRGTFGNLEGGAPQSGVNYSLQLEAWGSGTSTVQKSFALPILGNTGTQSGTYTALIADIATAPDMYPKFIEWFASGGTQGYEPNHYSTLTFTYDATSSPSALPNALTSVQYGSQVITEGADVLQESVTPNTNNPSGFWRFNFDWPNFVSNQNALLTVFKGTYGALDGVTPVSGTNYSATVQAWAAGSNNLGKFMSLPGLESEVAPGTYTVMVAERDPKFSSNSTDQEALWFATGGTQGVAPRAYSLLTFTLTAPPKCCSSVLFLPGFQASELYEQTTDTEAKRWLPGLLQSSVESLRMNPDGTPQHTLYTKPDGAIKSVSLPILGTEVLRIYKTFLAELDEMQGAGTIADWEAFPYDWRMNVEDVVEQGVQYPDGTHNLVDEVTALAAASKTKKVTIVGHSNGGLVAKALMIKLALLGKTNMVDRVVFVGTPQLGTPKAIASLLHGDEQDIPQGAGSLMLSKSNARALAEYMPGAFGLLPSAKYYELVADPVANLTRADQLRGQSGTPAVIDTYSEAQQFMSGNGLRQKPAAIDIEEPNTLRSSLLAQAGVTHSKLDSWVPPPGVDVIQIAGWGLDTVKGITYWDEAKTVCPTLFTCSVATTTRHSAGLTRNGDRTVVTPSSVVSDFSKKYYIDLAKSNSDNDLNQSHVDLTEVKAFQVLFQNLVLNTLDVLPEYSSVSEPVVNDQSKILRLRVMSPASILAKNSLGQVTGLVTNPIPGSDFFYKKEEIPNSYYEEFGDTKYLGLPQGQYDFSMLGTDTGHFTLEIEKVVGDTSVSETSLVDIPVTPSTKVSFSTDADASLSAVQVDKNGDGATDFIISPNMSGEVVLPKAPIVVTARNESVQLGSQIPAFTYDLSGFVAGEGLSTSDITGTPLCTTTATPMSPVGVYPITCTAGTLASSYYKFEDFIAGTLTITYNWSGFLKPINEPADEPSVFKAGSVVSVKFKLLNAKGETVRAAAAPLWITPVQGDQLNEPRNERRKYKRPTKGDEFIWDAKQKQYVYNWNTKDFKKGYWYEIGVQLDDGTIKTIIIGLK